MRDVPEAVLRRDRIIVLSGLALIAGLSWTYVFSVASDMQAMDMKSIGVEMMAPRMQAWSVADVGLTFGMWAVMMAAMMTPAAAPMILMFAQVNRGRRKQEVSYVPAGVFLVGYLVVWAVFSVMATAAQWGLHTASLLPPMTVRTSGSVVGGVLLLVAGIYQWTTLKHACLSKCRSPLGFVLNEWRDGRWGAFLMGLKHGGYCTGCCWALMALLFGAGVMNPLWVAAIAGFVLLEKVAPAGDRLGRLAGMLFIGWGLWMVAGAL